MAFPRRSASVLLASLLLLLWTAASARLHDPPSSDLSPAHRVKRDQPFENREKFEKTFELIKDSISVGQEILKVKDVLEKLGKFASLAPGGIGAIFSIINVILIFIPQDDPVMNEVKKGFAEVNRKLDSISIKISNLATDVEWFNYASVYSQDELHILNAWTKFDEFRENAHSVQGEEDKLRLAEIFVNYYEYTGTEASVANLYHYLTVDSTSLSGNLNVLLSKKFKCDIKKIGEHNFYFSTLLWKGMVLNEIYWKLIGFKSRDKRAEHAEKFRNVYAAQMSTVDSCLNNIQSYIKEDMIEITKALPLDNKETIAKEVKKALDQKYDWYDWVVLVFNKDKDDNYIRNDLTEISVDKITVAVGPTRRGDDQHEDDLITLATKCFEDKLCDIKQKMLDCDYDLTDPFEGKMPNIEKLKDYGTATHAAYGDEHVQVPQPLRQYDCDWVTTYGTYTRKISVYSSRKLPVCSEGTCMNGGTCKALLDSNESLCECQNLYFGSRCEEKMNMAVVQEVSALYPAPDLITTAGKLKMIESKLNNILDIFNTRCPG